VYDPAASGAVSVDDGSLNELVLSVVVGVVAPAWNTVKVALRS
jgi:hypothetical protein